MPFTTLTERYFSWKSLPIASLRDIIRGRGEGRAREGEKRREKKEGGGEEKKKKDRKIIKRFSVVEEGV